MAGRADSLESAAAVRDRRARARRGPPRATPPRGRRRRGGTAGCGLRRRRTWPPRWSWPTTARAAAEAARTEREAALASVRREIGTLGDELRELTDSRAPRRGRPHPAAAADRGAGDQGGRGARHRPGRAGGGLRPAPARAGRARPRDECARRPSGCEPQPFVREEQDKRLRAAERKLTPARQGQPAGAGGVRRAGGAAQVPHRAARGPQELQARPARHRQGGRRAGREGLHRGLRTTPPRSSSASSRGSSPAARAGWCSPTPTTC